MPFFWISDVFGRLMGARETSANPLTSAAGAHFGFRMLGSLFLHKDARLHQLEDILPFLLPVLHEGTVQEIHNRRRQPEARHNLGC
jgi:hypothetical protein